MIGLRGSDARRPVWIREVDDADTSLAWRFAPGERLAVDADGLVAEETRAWEEELNRHYLACGCDEGAVAMLVVTVAVAAWLLFRPGSFVFGGFELGVTVGGLGSAAVLGKAAGLLAARLRLAWTLERLGRRLGAIRSGQPDGGELIVEHVVHASPPDLPARPADDG